MSCSRFWKVNRCRAILVGAARVLAGRGYAVHIPDLPGTGESERQLRDVSWAEWRDYTARAAEDLRPAAVLRCAAGPCSSLPVRPPGGCLRWTAQDFPAFRLDWRGVGDSSGEDPGHFQSVPNLAAALAAFRREQPQLTRVVGFGLCDGANALAVNGSFGLDALVPANPWLVGAEKNAPAPAAFARA